MTAYYNEIDPKAAATLRELIRVGAIAPGEVDERSIADVHPGDLVGFRQCHFFAGGGVWGYALRLAGWPDDREVWTGSCPCQPFSVAGRQRGTKDERHLWPELRRLKRERRPAVVFGEQVASPAGRTWLDAVRADVEEMGYAFGGADLCAAGVGAPHIRQRLFWMAHRLGSGLEGHGGHGDDGHEPGWVAAVAAGSTPAGGAARGMANHAGERYDGWRPSEASDGRDTPRSEPQRLCDVVRLDESDRTRHQRTIEGAEGSTRDETRLRLLGEGCGQDRHEPAGPVNGHWRAADWLYCRDGKWRPVEPGTFPLAHGAPARVGRLRLYGNAIVAQVAEEFIRACDEVIGDVHGLFRSPHG